MRLDKRLSSSGQYTRSEARGIIRSGAVLVNGVPETDPAASVPEAAVVTVRGVELGVPGHIHLMMNKPAGVVTAMSDARLETIADLISPVDLAPGLGPVGRLDRDVTGLVILTTDGQLAHRLISPRWKQDKVYLATVSGAVDDACARAFSSGIDLGEYISRPAELEILSSKPEESHCRVTMREGRFHQVKLMFAACDHAVISLSRESIAGVSLDKSLPPGHYRALNDREIAALYSSVEL